MDNYKINYKLFLILTFFSGLPVLIYEIVWARMLTNFLGSSVYSITIITVGFMLGLALGSYFFGRYADSITRYLRLYALIEFCIGLSALSVPILITVAKIIKFGIFPFNSSYATLFMFQRMLVASFILIIPTFFMGGTLPVLSKFIRRNLKSEGRMLGYLYSFNTIGAIIGCLLVIFVMVERLGLMHSLIIASAINIFIGLITFVFDYRFRLIPETYLYEEKQSILKLFTPENILKELSVRQKLLLFVFGISGFTALAYEMLWIRMLIFWLNNTTVSFGLILAIFLGCIALGSFASSHLIDKLSEKQLRNIFAALQLFISIAALAAMYLYNLGVANFMAAGDLRFYIDYNVAFQPQLLMIFLTFFLIAFPFGMIFPLAIKILLPGEFCISRYVGLGYMVNTFGSMLGALITGLIFIPILGVQKSIYLISFINILLFGLIFVFNDRVKISKVIIVLTTVFSFFIVQMFIPGNFLKKVMASKVSKMGGEMIFLKEDRDATVIVAKLKDNICSLWINGFRAAATVPEMQYKAHIPLLLSPDPKDVLVVGFGTGVTLGVVAQLYGIKTDCVEISKSVIEAGGLFSKWNYNVLSSGNINLFIMDARNFIELTKKKYDVIIVDALQPYQTNTNSLFSKEFYAGCYKILKDDGIMLQWISCSTTTKINFQTLVKTFISVFDNSYLLLQNMVIGAKKPLSIDPEVIEKKISRNETIARELRLIDINNSNALMYFFVADKNKLAEFTKNASIITDDRPLIEFTVFRDGVFGNYNPMNFYSQRDIMKMRSKLNLNKLL